MRKKDILKSFLYSIGFLLLLIMFIRVMIIGSVLLYYFTPRGDIVLFFLIFIGFSISFGVFIWATVIRGPSTGVNTPTHQPTPLWDGSLIVSKKKLERNSRLKE